MITSNRLYMSSRLTTFSYIQDSGVNYWDINQVTTLAHVVQNIQDGWYNDNSKIYLDTIRYMDHAKPSLGVVIKGLSLGNGQKEIYKGSDIAECVNGIKGRIAIIYEYYGEKRIIDLSDIRDITRGNTIDRTNLMDTSNQVDPINSNTTIGKGPSSSYQSISPISN